MPSAAQVDSSRVFSEEEFLYLCASYERDRSIPENIGRNRNVNLSHENDDFRDVAISHAVETPRHSTCFLTVPTSVRGPKEDIYQAEEEKSETDLDSEMSGDSFVPYASDTSIYSDRGPNYFGTMIQDEVDTPSILTRIDRRTGEFCVQIEGHSYPIDIGEFESTVVEQSKWTERLSSNQLKQSPNRFGCKTLNTCFRGTESNKNERAHFKHEGDRNIDDTFSEDGDTAIFENESCDKKHLLKSRQQKIVGPITSQYQSWEKQPNVVFNNECDDEVNGSPFQCSHIDYGAAENSCEQKWFDDLAQYGDSLTRNAYGNYFCEPSKQWRDCSWESDYNRTEFTCSSQCADLPPVTEILPKTGENLYVNETQAFGYDITDSQLSGCSINPSQRDFQSCMIQSRSGSRLNIPNFPGNKTAGYFRPCQSEVFVSTRIRNKEEAKSDHAGCRLALPVCSSAGYSRESFGIDAKKQMKKMKRGCRLWEFIRNLLLDPSTNPSLIRWENKDEGTFKLVQSKAIAYKWGMKKGNEGMTYEKLSRAMRYYYKRQVFQPVLGKRLVYRFGPRATGWKSEK